MQTKPLSLIPAAFLALCLQPAQSKPQSFIAEAYGHPQHLVRVEGTRRLNLVCVGKGEPAAILLYGLGSGSYDWRKVQPAIGQITKVCTYDRAGQGFSDPSNRPSDATNAILDLHALLHAAGLSKRIVLVGHSLGGFYATLYAETYPEDIAGMVLVEPAFSGQGQVLRHDCERGPCIHPADPASRTITLDAMILGTSGAPRGRLRSSAGRSGANYVWGDGETAWTRGQSRSRERTREAGGHPVAARNAEVSASAGRLLLGCGGLADGRRHRGNTIAAIA
jgi:pimeloyl-ACP methyl ester carboxylesterase